MADLKFNPVIRKLEPTDKAHADIFNDNFQNLSENDNFLKKQIEDVITGHQSDMQTIVQAHQQDIQTITTKHNEDVQAINAEIAATKKSVSDGKTLVAAAITRKRIDTAADATFKQMADNIDQIKLGFGNARPDQVLEGITFSTADGVELVGTIPAHGTYTTALSVVRNGDNNDIHARIPKGAYLEIVQNPNSMLPEIVLPRMDVVMAADIAPGKIRAGFNILGIEGDAWVVWTGDCSQNSDALLTGCSMWAFGNKITGTMPKHGGYTTAEMVAYANGILYARIPRGGYMDVSPGSGTHPEITMSDESVRNAIGLTPDKIKKGETILGIAGTAANGKYNIVNNTISWSQTFTLPLNYATLEVFEIANSNICSSEGGAYSVSVLNADTSKLLLDATLYIDGTQDCKIYGGNFTVRLELTQSKSDGYFRVTAQLIAIEGYVPSINLELHITGGVFIKSV